MSLISEHTAPVISHTQTFLPHTSLHLLALNRCAAIYSGEFEAAVSQITRTAGMTLGVERFSIWLYQPGLQKLNQADTYLLTQNCHTSGLSISAFDYPGYFQSLTDRDCLIINDITQVGGLKETGLEGDASYDEVLKTFVQDWLEPRNIQSILEIPIRYDDRVVGVVRCEQVGSPRYWGLEEQHFVIAIATLVALALETQKRRQQDQAVQRQQQYTRLFRSLLESHGDIQNSSWEWAALVRQVGQSLGASRCLIWTYNSTESSALSPLVEYFTEDRLSWSEEQFPIQSHPYYDALLSQDSPIIFQPDHDLTLKQLVLPANLQAEMDDCVTIRTVYQGKVNGIISLHPTQAPAIWPEDGLSMLQSLATYVGIAIAHTQLMSREQQHLSKLKSQERKLQREIIERQQAEQAWQESQCFIQNILDASTNILYVNDFATGQNSYISRWINNVLGYQPEDILKMGNHFLEQLAHGEDLEEMRAQRRRLSFLNNGEIIEMEFRLKHRQGNWRWLLCRETVFHRNSEGVPTQIFGTVTDITERKQAEEALYEVNRELKRLASVDGLTQVANRRSFDEYLLQEWQNLRNHPSPLTLILCDIDYFKLYNDAYGHQAGDICLQKVAQAIDCAVKRNSDLVARYGGEEFAVILPNTSLEGAKQVVDNIQREVNSLQIPHCQSKVGKYITVSMGISATSFKSAVSPDALIAAADRGLYQAKYEGRNRCCLEYV